MRSVTTRRPDGEAACARIASVTSALGAVTPRPRPTAQRRRRRGRRRRRRGRGRRRRPPPAPRLLGRAEVAELLAGLVVPGVLERHGLGGRRLAGRRVARRPRSPRSTAVAAVARGRRPPPPPPPPALVAVSSPTSDSESLPLRGRCRRRCTSTSSPRSKHVLDPVDALAAAELGDVEQAVAAREDVDERTELGDVHDPARCRSAPTSAVGGSRISSIWRSASSTASPSVEPMRHRADHAVVVDGDVGAGLLLDRVDDLALGPDDLADLVDRDLEADDLRCGRADLGAGLGDRARA